MSFTQTLILNHMYQPHEVVDWKVATTRMFCGKVEVLEQYDEILGVVGKRTLQSFPALKAALRQVIGSDAEAFTIRVPAVAVVRRPIRRMKSRIRFSKVNVCARDRFTCQYCETRLPMSRLNFDHVMPKSRGGKTEWTNIVTACYPCNTRKRNRTPDEAGMLLLRSPVRPLELPLTGPRIDSRTAPSEWHPYLVAAAGAVQRSA